MQSMPFKVLEFGWAAAVAALLLTFAAHGADETAAVAKPQVKVGDRWSYRRTDSRAAGVVRYASESRVEFVGPDEIVVAYKRSDRGGESEEFYTSEWNTIATQDRTFIPRAGFLKFPLKVGDSYETSYEMVFKETLFRAKYDFVIKVVGWEDLVVPAGKFRALRLEAIGTYVRLDLRANGRARLRFWYVPEIKRVAKSIYEAGTRSLDSPDDTSVVELVSFSVQ
jgi:hypothetical protein